MGLLQEIMDTGHNQSEMSDCAEELDRKKNPSLEELLTEYQTMLKTVLFLRLTTAKLRVKMTTVLDPELEASLEMLEDLNISDHQKNGEESGENILSLQEVQKSIADMLI